MVATGGSGHAVKFLPTLGRHIVDRIEGKSTELNKLWKWRNLQPGQRPYNRIMEGFDSERVLAKQCLTGDDSLDKLRSRI